MAFSSGMYNLYAENCMKMKEFGPGGVCPGTPLELPREGLVEHFFGQIKVTSLLGNTSNVEKMLKFKC